MLDADFSSPLSNKLASENFKPIDIIFLFFKISLQNLTFLCIIFLLFPFSGIYVAVCTCSKGNKLLTHS